MKQKISHSKIVQQASCIMLVLNLFISLNSFSQTVFWAESFANSCATGCLANTYVGANGAWAVTQTGTIGSNSNKWFVSGAECGNAAGQCGTDCGTTASSLHIGADDVIALDAGASYDAGGLFQTTSDWRAESPTINCSSKIGIKITFNYMMEGDASNDFASLAYYDGLTWSYYNGSAWAVANTPLLPSLNSSCSPQVLWTFYTASLPASANNNPNVKIGFRWINNNDGVGTDPSIAVDNIKVSYNSITTTTEDLNSISNSVIVYPNPARTNVKVSFLKKDNSDLNITIINGMGQTVHAESHARYKGNFNEEISLQSLAKGIYFLQIKSDKETINRKLIVE